MYTSLKENVLHHLQDKLGLCSSDRHDILTKLFGSRGLATATDDLSFDIRKREIIALIQDKAPGFIEYFTRRVVPMLQKNLQNMENTGLPNSDNIPWTNNNSESGNHILKQATQWKSQSLVDLIDILHSTVETQYKDLKRSLIPGLGNFRLVDSFKKCILTGAAWEQMSKQKQQTHFHKLLTTNVLLHRHAVCSTDEKLVVYEAAHGGKKKDQLKRKRNAKTTTIQKQPKLD
jgi:hypothetical protein